MGKRILLITPVPSHPQTAGNRARIYNLGLSIKKLGHELYFAHVEKEPGDVVAMSECWGNNHFFSVPYTKPKKILFRFRRKLKRMLNLESRYVLKIDDWYDDTVNGQLIKLYQQFRFDIILVEYAFFSKVLNCFPDHVLKLVDTHDVLTNRHKLYLDKNNKYSWFSTTANQEKKGLQRADFVIAIQEAERAFFSEQLKLNTVMIGHTVKTVRSQTNCDERNTLLFIGSANQSNVDAIENFLSNSFPTVKQVIPNVKLLIAGPVGKMLKCYNDSVIYLGEFEDVESIYKQADIVINPIRFGTGLKIKNIEALGYSKPLVTTSIGAIGLNSGADTAFLVADNDEDFSNKVIDVIEDSNLCKRLSIQGYKFACKWNKEQEKTLEYLLQ